MRTILITSILLSIAILFHCTREVEKIIYPNGDPNATGAVVGLVKQKDSNAKVFVRQATPIDSTVINPLDGTFRFDSLQVGNYDLYVKARNYGTYWLRNLMVNAGGVTYAGEISLSDVPDLVASHYPEDESEIVFDRRFSQLSISISFTEAMDRESVEEAFSTDPPSEGVFYWGSYTYEPTPRYFWDEDALYDKSGGQPGANITTFSKVKSFTYRMARKDCYTDTTYTIALATTAKDTAGNHLRFPLQFRFSTVQSSMTQNAILTDPEHGDIYVDPMEHSSIFMTFPRRMDQVSVESSLTISPSSDVIYVWPTGNQLRIYTGGPLMCSTLYELHLDGSALDLDGIALGEPFNFSFETAAVEVESTNPQSGEIFVLRNSKISIQFNTYMVASSVQAAFSINPGIGGRFIRGYENNNGRPKDVITFIPSTQLAANTKYTVTVGTSAYDLHGTNLEEAYSFAFVTEPE